MESEVRELLIEELKDAYSAEKQALRCMQKALETSHRAGPARGYSTPHRANSGIPTNSRRQRFLQRGIIALRVMEAA